VKPLSKPDLVYWSMIAVLATVAALLASLPQDAAWGVAPADLPASPPVIALATFGIMAVLYGGLGLAGLRLSVRLGFAGIWDEHVSQRTRFVRPAYWGVGLGVVFIAVDRLFAGLHGFGPLPHPPFPASVGASLTAGIGEEVIFRLFFISFWTWLVSRIVLRGRALNAVFGGVTALSAVVFAVAHVPAVMYMLGIDTVGDMPVALGAELLLLNGVLSIVAALQMRRYGILAAVGVHFWTDVVWHVVWGAVTGASWR
jgi:hypothetical protein